MAALAARHTEEEMKNGSPPADDGKTPQERFLSLGKKLMAVPKSEIDEREKKWQRTRKRPKRA